MRTEEYPRQILNHESKQRAIVFQTLNMMRTSCNIHYEYIFVTLNMFRRIRPVEFSLPVL